MVDALTKPRVYCLHPLPQEAHELATKLFDFVPYGADGWQAWPEEAEGLMVRGATVTEDDIKRFSSKFRFIAKHGVGVDQLAMRSLKAKGVTVMNTPGVNAGAVAELALGLAMSVARQIPYIDRQIRDGSGISKASAGALGIQLSGRTLGLIGGGNIGFKLGQMFHGAFESTIVVYDPYLSPAMATQWQEALPTGKFVRAETLEGVLRAADVLSIHVPLVDSTRDLIGIDQLKLMMPSAILINTARGGIVNEDALAEALEQNIIMGAGIDAFVTEPPTLESASRLVSQPRAVSTPHIGAASLDVIKTTAVSVIQHLHEALSGKEPRDVVTYA